MKENKLKLGVGLMPQVTVLAQEGGGNVSHPIHKVSVEGGEKWVVWATFQAGLARVLNLSGKSYSALLRVALIGAESRHLNWSNEDPFAPPPHGCKWAVTGPAPAISLIYGSQGILKEKHNCSSSLFLPALLRRQDRGAQVINDLKIQQS